MWGVHVQTHSGAPVFLFMAHHIQNRNDHQLWELNLDQDNSIILDAAQISTRFIWFSHTTSTLNEYAA